ncbi:MAG: type II toxin-antitoxin system HicB family antitoxin [Geminicoccaceae bacterium]
MNFMGYKDYLGSVEFDEDERIFYGRLEFIRGLVSYEATDAEGLVRAFRQAVDDYLAHCEEAGTPPERPLKGTFNIRTGPDLHRRAVVAASRAGMSLNAFVTRALEAAVADELDKSAAK